MEVPIIIPVRGLHKSMSRLRKHIENEKVDKIVTQLLDKTILAVENYKQNVILLTSDRELSEKYPKLKVIIDPGDDLNAALFQLSERVITEKYFLLMPDLPLISSASVEKVIHIIEQFPYVIVPTDDNGTAACILPRTYFQLGLFGVESAIKFLKQAENDHISLAKFEMKTLSRDLDTPTDYSYWSTLLEDEFFE